MIKLLSTKDVAERIGCALSNVSILKKKGELTPVEKHGKTFMYDANDIDEYIGEQEVFITLSDGTEVNESFVLEAIKKLK